MFVLSLKRGMYLYQFGQYAWTHMILMIIFVPSSFFVSNIFEGLIWLILPSALIITNDIMAYLAGAYVSSRTVSAAVHTKDIRSWIIHSPVV